MIHCQNCGQSNSPESNFCRACGNRFANEQTYRQPQPQQSNYENDPPRPYSWKTDEYQTLNEARKPAAANRPAAFVNQNVPPPGGMMYRQPSGVTSGYRCPNCGTNYLPVTERRVSTAGWIVFSILLVFTWIFFWVGLLMKENVAVCPVCKMKIN